MTFTPMISLLERYLDLSSSRHTLITSNMANVDTPGYHTKDIDFRSELHRAVTEGGAQLTPVARNVSGLMERPDGNNVSLERESLLLAQNQIQYRMGTQFVRHEFQRLMTAIKEGNSQ